MSNYVQTTIAKLEGLIPGNDPDLLRLYALLVYVRGHETTLEDVHHAWALWRNQTAPDHRSLVPFGLLSPEVQALDAPHRDAIHEASRMCACTDDEACPEHDFGDAGMGA